METVLGKRLTETQLARLGQRLIAREKNLAAAMRTLREKRRKYKKWAEGDYSDRKTTNEQDIFSKRNIPTEFITGVADFMVARTCEDIFGSDPYFAALPQGPADQELSDQVQKHFGYKLREARFVPLNRQLIWRGYHLGEGIGKVTWRRDEDVSEESAMVLCARGQPDPVTDGNGDYIHEDDSNLQVPELGLSLWAKSEIMAKDPQAQFAAIPEIHPLPVLVDAEGVPVVAGDGEYWFESDVQLSLQEGEVVSEFLSKSPIVSQDESMGFEERAIEDRIVIYEGLDVSLVEHDDLTWPLNVRHISEALDEGVFHRLSLTSTQLRENYGVSEKLIAQLQGDDEREKSTANQPQTNEDAKGTDCEWDEPRHECFETYIRLDVLENGKPVRVFALVYKPLELVLAIDYLARVTPSAIVPFYLDIPCPMPGRCHGRGYQEIYENETDFIDRTFNAIIYRNDIHANPPKFIRPDAFEDATAAKRFSLAPDTIWRIKREFEPDKVVGTLTTFPDVDQRSVWIFELVIQMVQVRSGVTGASQGALANLPSNGTATGVQSIMMSGSTLHKLPIENIKDGIEDGLQVAVQILYARQNTEETFAYMEGDAAQLMTFNPRNVRDIKMNVRLLLTRLHEREALESAKAAIEAVGQYIALPEAEKDGVRPLFVQVLKALRVQGADAILRKAIPPDPNAPPPQQERFTESLNYKDAPPSIQRQMERAAGYEPASEEEVAQMKEEAARETREKGAKGGGDGGPESKVEAAPLPENAS